MGRRDRERERERRGRHRSPERERVKSRERSRSRDRERTRRRRSPSVEITSVIDKDSSMTNAARAALLSKQKRAPPLPSSSYPSSSTDPNAATPSSNPEDLIPTSQEQEEMQRIMGFTNFDTTKGKQVENNEAGGVHLVLKRKYRQYMNRKGGFNRPLDFVA